jgi:3,4-dihydroxy-9,10-secoandrosta-1,3,5(10)-triene-9,17-dione 4,5-dioxygenase
MSSPIFGLGYLTLETTDLDRWRELAVDVLGMVVGDGPDPDALYLRIDDRPARLILLPGETDRLVNVGWEAPTAEALRDAVRRLEDAGAPVKAASGEEADLRRVQELVTTTDPAGTPLEIFHGSALVHDPLITPSGARFITGDQGMGHVVLPTKDPQASYDFYTQVLGFRSRGAMRVPGAMVPKGDPDGRYYVRFLSTNPRHHTLALGPWWQPNGIIHFMLEVAELDDVGRALDRLLKRRFHLSSTLGRHTNDHMVSFYVQSPTKCDVELGCFGRRIDDTSPGATYSAEDITADSFWGHRWNYQAPK